MIRAFLLFFVLLAGCMPKGSIARRDEIPADRYTFTVALTTTTTGLPVEPFTSTIEGDLLASYTRTFRDGSVGRLIRFEKMRPPSLEGAWVELRTFPDGPVLTVGPLAPWAGKAGHIELLDVLWPALSPKMPAPGRAGTEVTNDTSWPIALLGVPPVRATTRTRWTMGERHDGVATLTYAGTLAENGGSVSGTGTTAGTVTLDTRAPRVSRHELSWSRTLTTTWPSGAVVTQQQEIAGLLAFAGTAPAPPLGLPVTTDDASVDAMPLRLADGTEPSHEPVRATEVLPFLLLPDGIGEEQWADLRGRLLEAGTMPR